MGLTFDKQLTLNAIIEALVMPDGLTFDIADARKLRDIILVDCGMRPVPHVNISGG